MIIELHNFGPIERFTFDTEKQMYFIFGENNVGKSYAISAVYLILKNWKTFTSSQTVNDIGLHNVHSAIQKKLKTLAKEIDINEQFESLSHFALTFEFLPILEKSFANSFSSIDELFNRYSRKTFKIEIKKENFSIEIIQKGDKLSLQKLVFQEKLILKQDDDEHISYHFKGHFIHVGSDINWTKSFIGLILDFHFWRTETYSIYFLPASRSGIYNGLSAFSAIIVQLTQLRNQIPNFKFDIPTLTEPISDYFLNISNIDGKGYNTPFSQFAKKIEDKIVKGKISFDRSNRKLYYEPAMLDLSLEVSQASSMISEMAPIIAHLKYILSKNQEKTIKHFLFIEEPEAHLHPKIQVELMRLFAELAENGLHIVMTSHSNYLFNKLSNMVLAKEIDPHSIRVCLMRMGKNGSFIDKNAMQIDDDGIDDDNFSDIAEELYSERLKLYEQNPS